MKKTLSLLLFIGIVFAAFAYQLPAPDSLGNRIPDFSYSGYRASETPIPAVAVKLIVQPTTDDATFLLQAAIDKVAALKPDANGFRGAILLQAGDYKISGQLRISASGIVIRGSGADKTNLIAAGLDRRTLIRIEGVNNRKHGDTLKVTDKYVPVGAMSFTVNLTKNIKIGDRITLVRPSTKAWIDALDVAHLGGGITSLGWKPNEHNIYWDRTITAIEGDKITIDAPVTTALDAKYGGGFVLPYVWSGRIENVGIENINFVSEYDAANAKDENHSWMAITVGNAADVWVRNCFFRHFVSSAVYVLETARRITVENCKYLSPVSEIGAHRRYAFFTMGQQCLFQRLYSEYGYHDFALGFCTPGPNAFVQCTAFLPYSYSGSIDSWASGVLFDIVNIEGNALKFTNLWQAEKGAAWNAANSVFWQCSPSEMDCFAPPTAMNWAIGSWSAYNGNGFWAESNNHVEPRSLFYAQLEKRLGADYKDRSDLIQIRTNPTSSPTIALARQLTDAARTPATLLIDWIDTVIMKNPIVSETSGAEIMKMPQQKAQIAVNKSFIKIENGKIVRDGKILTGGSHKIQYWSGTDQPSYLKTASPHITRYVPGRTGTGLTDDIDSVVTWMKRRNIVAFDHNYGLWYDRRRDDHERIRRMNGDVWAPFYEQPFARSGEGTGYDGLSKYDLTKFNFWYWSRLKQFADLADREGLVLLHEDFFQHNIIEAGAHWAD
ncbi:MAG: DUF6298 domain-containing protein, partial [Paludibacter sp.]|nr:DUF6298 domain-containing protein [Paludibacter sp.]